MRNNISVMDGVRAVIGYEIGLLIFKAIKAVFKFFRLCLALYVMFEIGDAIKADQAKNGASNHYSHSNTTTPRK